MFPVTAPALKLSAVLMAVGTGCGTPPSQPPSSQGLASDQDRAPAGALTPAQEDAQAVGLRWMREEEKVARDVYRASAERYRLTVFDRIADAEQRHMDAVLARLQARGLDDPIAGQGPGAFSDPAMASLFDTLSTRSAVSEAEALRVGAEIEEIDLADLEAQLATPLDEDVRRVYENLARASRNHLRAFVGQLADRGVVYRPTRLNADVFDAIVSSERERGGRGDGGGRGAGRQRRGRR